MANFKEVFEKVLELYSPSESYGFFICAFRFC